MSELAARLVDHVLPHVPIRQWVFTVPVPVRSQLAFDAALTRSVLRVFLRTVRARHHSRDVIHSGTARRVPSGSRQTMVRSRVNAPVCARSTISVWLQSGCHG